MGTTPAPRAPRAGAPPRRRAARRAAGPGSIESRQDAVKAINLICAYLDRHEPTNPAQLLLRRAERLIDKSFMQLVQDLAPDAMSEVARIMGVDPNDFGATTDPPHLGGMVRYVLQGTMTSQSPQLIKMSRKQHAPGIFNWGCYLDDL